PLGRSKARKSGVALRRKPLWSSSSPGVVRLPDANTTRYCPGPSVVGGNSHLAGSSTSSVNLQSVRSTATVPELKISIQSDVSPSLSLSPLALEARNSEMVMESAPSFERQLLEKPSNPTRHTIRLTANA